MFSSEKATGRTQVRVHKVVGSCLAEDLAASWLLGEAAQVLEAPCTSLPHGPLDQHFEAWLLIPKASTSLSHSSLL